MHWIGWPSGLWRLVGSPVEPRSLTPNITYLLFRSAALGMTSARHAARSAQAEENNNPEDCDPGHGDSPPSRDSAISKAQRGLGQAVVRAAPRQRLDHRASK